MYANSTLIKMLVNTLVGVIHIILYYLLRLVDGLGINVGVRLA